MAEPDADALIADLRDARERYDEATASVDAIGRERLETLAETLRELDRIVATYEERAVGTGDFGGYVAFRAEIEEFVEDLPEDLPHREALEAVDDIVDKRRLSEDDIARIEPAVADAREAVARLDEVADAREAYRSARGAVEQRVDTIDSRIDHLEHLRSLGEADLDAPVEEIREPIETYNDAVRTAFGEFVSSSPAKSVLELFALADRYPLVPMDPPPSGLVEYLEALEEPLTIPELVEYADYSDSKLAHYVDDPAALRAAVRTDRTYLERRTPDPFTIDWPPPTARELHWRIRELTAVVGRFAEGPVLQHLRRVRERTADPERFDRLREAAEADAELDAADRHRLRERDLAAELEALRDEKAHLEEALEAHPPP